jgi:cell division septal protein FtsQ
MKGKIWKSLLVITAVATLVVFSVGIYTVVHYLQTSPRFDVKRVAITGLKRVEEAQVYAQAGLKEAGNVFAIDLEATRESVEGLRWVRYATVQRVLPDTISIKVVEREPVGLARIRGAIFQFDAQAELLDQDRGAGVNFPILDGLKVDDPASNQKKVDLYIRIMEDLHGQNELSEVHINDAGEVSVVSLSEPLLVNLGAEQFRTRWGRYLQLRTQIQQEYPEAVQVDFRFKGQVILKTRPDAPDEQKVVWDAEKRSL